MQFSEAVGDKFPYVPFWANYEMWCFFINPCLSAIIGHRRDILIIGIDVGGTNIDGVIIKNKKILKKVKNPVDRSKLFETIYQTLKELIDDVDKTQIKRINLSTTISTNAIVEKKIEDVLMIIQSGPGIKNDFSKDFKFLEEITGYVDHRGIVVRELNKNEIQRIQKKNDYKNIDSLGVVTKFSTRNPQSEIKIKDILKDDFQYISLGHSLSGNLNFPRRVNTVFLNSSVSKVFSNFLHNIKLALKEEGIDAPVYILKADGGTMLLEDGYDFPVQSVLSGPAASFMGITALEETNTDSIYLDIGGTTTDIFFLVDGQPLFEPNGIEIDGRKTLVRAIFSSSIGLGGDSYAQVKEGEIKIGPERLDFPLALGGKYPTVTDAMRVLDLIDFGDKDKSLKGLEVLGNELGVDAIEISKNILKKSAEIIYTAVNELLEKINSKPLFTVREVLEGRKLIPEEIKIIGGPAKVLAPFIEERFNLSTRVTENSEIANAIGAALSKPTYEINLHADTVRKFLSIPEADIYRNIAGSFSLEEGKSILIELLEDRGKLLGEEIPDIEILEENEFNMVDGWNFGKNIRIKGQIRPGLLFPLRSDNFEDEK